MEKGSWGIPEDGPDREERIAEVADDLCARYDKIIYEILNRALAEIRDEGLEG